MKFRSQKGVAAKIAIRCEKISQPSGAIAKIPHPAAKIDFRCEIILQPLCTLCKNFRSCESPPWHTSAISQSGISFRNCELAATFSTPGDPPFRSRGTISKGVSQLRNPSLAHERHFAKSYARSAAVKWAAKSMPNFPSLRKRLAAAKSAPPHCEKTPLLRKGTVTFGVLFKRYKFNFSYF